VPRAGAVGLCRGHGADDGEQADEALALGIYDLAILDIGLPGMSGLEVLRRLRAASPPCRC
jgi:DNA-binding response OmpR family regulator